MDNRMENRINYGMNNSMGYNEFVSGNIETEEIKNEIEIDVRGLFAAILNRLIVIILIGILIGGVAFAYTQYFVDRQYVATTKVYILSKQDPNQKALTASDISFASYLAKDYEELLATRPVLEEVKKELNLDKSVDTLQNMITVSLKEETRLMEISVTSTDPKLAKKIADKVVEVANERLKVIMDGLEPVRLAEEAEVPTVPSSPNVKKNAMIGFIVGFGISLLVVIIMFVLDDTIKTPDDIEKRLGVSVLAAIPLKSADSSSRRGSYGYGYGHSESKKKNDKKKVKQKDKDKKVQKEKNNTADTEKSQQTVKDNKEKNTKGKE